MWLPHEVLRDMTFLSFGTKKNQYQAFLFSLGTSGQPERTGLGICNLGGVEAVRFLCFFSLPLVQLSGAGPVNLSGTVTAAHLLRRLVHTCPPPGLVGLERGRAIERER